MTTESRSPSTPPAATQEGPEIFTPRHCYVSESEQVVFDEHASDQEHLRAQATHGEQPLYRCRTYLKDIIPKEWLGKHGQLKVSTYKSSLKTVVSLTFIPD